MVTNWKCMTDEEGTPRIWVTVDDGSHIDELMTKEEIKEMLEDL